MELASICRGTITRTDLIPTGRIEGVATRPPLFLSPHREKVDR